MGRTEVIHGPLWEYNYLINLWLVGSFVFFGIRYGFLGVKLEVERQRNTETRSALSKGSILMQKVLQSEVRSIVQLSAEAKAFMQHSDMAAALEAIKKATAVNAQLLTVLDRVKAQTEEIRLIMGTFKASDMLQQLLAEMQPQLLERGIAVTLQMECDSEIDGDPVLIRRAVGSVLRNAIEAVPAIRGQIRIIACKHRRRFKIAIHDNGSGIPALSREMVFEPFFSTKEGMEHFGLGLTQCFSIMSKHGGLVRIVDAEQTQGTTVELILPRKWLLTSGGV